MAFGIEALFEGSLTHPVTKYIAVPVQPGGIVGVSLGWKDATSSGTFTLELTSHGPDEAPYDAAGDAWEWVDSGESITSPAATAASGTTVRALVGARRARIKYVTAANSDIVVYDGMA